MVEIALRRTGGRLAIGRLPSNAVRLLLLIWSVMVIFPLFWALYSSLKDNKAFYADPWAWPDQYHFENFHNAWVSSHIANYFLNSTIVVVAALFLSLLMGAMTAYALARFRFRGNQLVLAVYLSSMMIPAILTLIPLYFVAKSLHLTNNLGGLIVVYAVGAVPFTVFLLIGFFKSIPAALVEAATIDGCSNYAAFYKIMLPLAKPGLITVSIVNVISFWNEYIVALTFIGDERFYTVPIGISFLSASMQYRTDFGALFAGLIISMVPVVLAYILFQRQLQDGMAGSAVKG
ncbi:carbohydrate ABC transporter permease [Cohnella sp. LGH]|uniref:N-acetylglucosamine transport system permease protein n=1 Tax=Cohnella phaseoli TaxID=456490 RepID=A0A3D9I5N8_9BACL|nr:MULTISPECIES: carbohydrate ABC transporter permease [Cohnella]QTH42526.1 carbohydrate ABC transporter permease [Cohnella sp. LGH]RED57068.1 N-acetylglucosamine transport system permease protein [Cohnella phaseoli]